MARELSTIGGMAARAACSSASCCSRPARASRSASLLCCSLPMWSWVDALSVDCEGEGHEQLMQPLGYSRNDATSSCN